MDTQNTSRQLRYLEEVRIPLHRAGFGTLPVEGEQLPVLWNGAPLCRISGKGSVFYRREDADTSRAEDVLYRVEDIATRSGLIQKEQLFSPEQLIEIDLCCADSVDEDFFELTDTQEEMIRGIQQQIRVCVPDLDKRVRQQVEALERASQEQTM